MDLYAKELKRAEILAEIKALRNDNDFRFNENNANQKPIAVRIWRNVAFESIEQLLVPFSIESKLNLEFFYGEYDDGLDFSRECKKRANNKKISLEILWLDLARYKIKTSDLANFIASKIQELESKSSAPILAIFLENDDFLNFKKELENNIKNTQNIVLYGICELLELKKEECFNDRLAELAGVRLSNFACVKCAQILGLRELPSFLGAGIKAVVWDLDNTLWGGILGEDGAENLKIDGDFATLRKEILRLKKCGIMQAVASKNELNDVREAFLKLPLGLALGDFDCVFCNWEDKAQNILKIAQKFNIGADSMLFIDDNPAEIQNVKSIGVRAILATSPNFVLRFLGLCGGVLKRNIKREDTLRSSDLAQNAVRAALSADIKDDKEYFENLCLELDFAINSEQNAPRIAELLCKTNQFISNFSRPNLGEILEFIKSENFCVISVSMRDRLSDSGIIACILGRMIESENIEIFDLCVSCRALGRRIEYILLQKSFALIAENLGAKNAKEVKILYKKGPKNEPFLRTLREISDIDSAFTARVGLQNINTQGLKISVKN